MVEVSSMFAVLQMVRTLPRLLNDKPDSIAQA